MELCLFFIFQATTYAIPHKARKKTLYGVAGKCTVVEIDKDVYNQATELFKNLGTTIEDMTVGFLKFCVIPENLPMLKAYLGIENAPAEAGAQMELHHRIFKQVFDIATKNTR